MTDSEKAALREAAEKARSRQHLEERQSESLLEDEHSFCASGCPCEQAAEAQEEAEFMKQLSDGILALLDENNALLVEKRQAWAFSDDYKARLRKAEARVAELERVEHIPQALEEIEKLIAERDALRASKTVVQCGFSLECRAHYDRAEKAEARVAELESRRPKPKDEWLCDLCDRVFPENYDKAWSTDAVAASCPACNNERAEKLYAELLLKRKELANAEGHRKKAEAERDVLQAKIDAVKAMHKPCGCGCYTCDEHCVTWMDGRNSCDTIAALEGKDVY